MKNRILFLIIIIIILFLLNTMTIKAKCIDTNNEVIHIKEDGLDFNLIIEKYKDGYISKVGTKIKQKPNKKSKTLKKYNLNKKIKYTSFNKEWVKVIYKDSYGFIKKKNISNKKIKYKEYKITKTLKFKSYMGYNHITDKASPQYKLQQKAYTGKYGIRMVNKRYCVALGSYFNISIGQHFDIILKNNTRIPCILGDEKDDSDTNYNHLYTTVNKCCTEFIVNTKYLKESIKKTGDVSNACKKWKSPIKKIIVYNKFYC